MNELEDPTISLEQASKLLGVPHYIFRRALSDFAIPSLSLSRTTGQHRRISLRQIMEHHDQALDEVIEASPRSKYWNSEKYKDALKEAAEIRQTIKDTLDADSVASRLGASRPTLRRLEREGRIIGVRPFGAKRVRYYRESIEAFEASLAAERARLTENELTQVKERESEKIGAIKAREAKRIQTIKDREAKRIREIKESSEKRAKAIQNQSKEIAV